MGIWGVGPFDNDAAGDMVGGLSKIIEKVNSQYDRRPLSIEKARYYYTDARAAAQFVLLAHATDILGGPSLEPVVRLLAHMRSDAGWIASFKQPKKIAKALEDELNEVMTRIRFCRGCRKTIGRSLDQIVREALASTVPRSERPKRKARRKP